MVRAAIFALIACIPIIGLSPSFADDLNGIRGPTPLTADHAALRPPKGATPEERQPRTSYESPPLIPHAITGYRLDAKRNDCLSCHARAVTPETPGAPMSVSHFMDQGGRVLASLTPGRYFCTQCHVIQTEASPPIGNDYQVFATPLRRYICLECHLPQPEDVPSSAAVSQRGAVPRH